MVITIVIQKSMTKVIPKVIPNGNSNSKKV